MPGEVGGYRPVESIPTPERAAQVAGAAAELGGAAVNIEGAAKVQMRNEQMKSAADKRLEGLEVSPGVGLAARAAIEAIAIATSFGATVEGLKAGMDSGLAGGCEAVARVVGDMKLSEWGRRVNIATQRAEASQLGMDKMEPTRESRKPDIRAMVPEIAGGLMEKLAARFHKSQGSHERRADGMKMRAESLRELKTEKAAPSPELKRTVSALEKQQAEQAAKIANLERYIEEMKGRAGEAARTVGGAPLEQVVAKGPFS